MKAIDAMKDINLWFLGLGTTLLKTKVMGRAKSIKNFPIAEDSSSSSSYMCFAADLTEADLSS
jgi:hypothetical protein